MSCPSRRAPRAARSLDRTLSRRTLLATGARAGLGGLAAAALPGLGATPVRAQATASPRVALMTTRNAGDRGAVDDLVAHLARAEVELGITTTHVVAVDPAAWEPTIRRLAQSGQGIIAVTWDAVEAALATAAAAFPGVRFIGIEAGPTVPALPNAVTVAKETYLGSHKARVLAGNVTLTRLLGVVGGVAGPRPHANANAFTAAAMAAEGPVDVTSLFAASWSDRAKGRELATNLVDAGADIVLADAGATDQGVIEVAQESGTFVIGGAEAIIEAAPGSVIATVAVLRGQALLEQIRAALDPGFTGGHLRSGIADGMVDLLVSDRFLAEGPAEMVERVTYAVPFMEDARQAIIAGTLVPRMDTLPPD